MESAALRAEREECLELEKEDEGNALCKGDLIKPRDHLSMQMRRNGSQLIARLEETSTIHTLGIYYVG